jgi:hypothetical protein
MGEQRETHLNYMSMLAFDRAILLVGVWTRNMVCNGYTLEEGSEFLILTSPICLDGQNLPTEKSLNELLKVFEFLKHIGFIF